MPHIDMSKTIQYCSQLLEQHPEAKFRDKVIYKLAVAHLDVGEQDDAKKYFSLLTDEEPDSPMALESHFRIGEYLFASQWLSGDIFTRRVSNHPRKITNQEHHFMPELLELAQFI